MTAAARPRARRAATPQGLMLPAAAGGELPDGPWVQAFWFTVDVPLQSKSNHRTGDKRRGKSTWGGLSSFENHVHRLAREQRPRGWDLGDPARPVGERPRLAVVVFGRAMLDTANLDKSLIDVLQGQVMVNDAQVAHVTEFSERTATAPGGLIAVARFPAGAALRTVARGAIALELACLDLLEDPAGSAPAAGAPTDGTPDAGDPAAGAPAVGAPAVDGPPPAAVSVPSPR